MEELGDAVKTIVGALVRDPSNTSLRDDLNNTMKKLEGKQAVYDQFREQEANEWIAEETADEELETRRNVKLRELREQAQNDVQAVFLEEDNARNAIANQENTEYNGAATGEENANAVQRGSIDQAEGVNPGELAAEPGRNDGRRN
jgi:hypothetical protein